MTDATCHICGTPLPEGYLRYCDLCVQQFSEDERKKREQVGRMNAFERQRRLPPVSYSTLTILIVALPAVAYFFVSAVAFGPGRNLLEHTLYFLIALSFFTSLLTLLWLWMLLLTEDFLWALGTLVLPILLYRFAQLRWRKPKVRGAFLVHILTLAAAAGLLVLLARVRPAGVWTTFFDVLRFARPH